MTYVINYRLISRITRVYNSLVTSGVPQVHARRSGHILMVSGKTGKFIGSYMKTPNDKETYMSPVVHTRKDGSKYILIGTGGETVGGRNACRRLSLSALILNVFTQY